MATARAPRSRSTRASTTGRAAKARSTAKAGRSSPATAAPARGEPAAGNWLESLTHGVGRAAGSTIAWGRAHPVQASLAVAAAVAGIAVAVALVRGACVAGKPDDAAPGIPSPDDLVTDHLPPVPAIAAAHAVHHGHPELAAIAPRSAAPRNRQNAAKRFGP